MNRLLAAYKDDPTGAWIFVSLLVGLGFVIGWVAHQ